MRICWFGIYKKDYSRNDILLTGLKEKNVEIVECHVSPTEKFRYLKLCKKLLKLKNDYDYIFAAYPSTSVVPIAKLLSRKKLIVDAFYSMYESAVIDRGLVSKYNPRAWKLWILDWLSILLGDVVVTDTKCHAEYWIKWPLVSILKKDKIKPLYLGVNDKLIFPISDKDDSSKNQDFLVHFHGTYIPLQGVQVIIEAIKITNTKRANIRWRLVGTGQTYSKITKLIELYGLGKNIQLIDRVPYEQLNILIDESSVVLGIFGETEKANRVIPNKVYEGLAAKKIVITKDTEAVKEIFSNNDLVLIPNKPEDLADAIIKIYDNPSEYNLIKEAGYQKIVNNYSPLKIAEQLLSILSIKH